MSMANVAAQLAGGHQSLIDQNPINLTFYRRARQRAGAAFEALPTEMFGPFKVRVHMRGGGSAQMSDRLTGWQERDSTWGLIAGPEVPFHVTDGEDGNVRVDFVHPLHGWFKLRRVRPVEMGGRLIGWQSDLERVSGSWAPEPEPHGRPPLESDPEWVAMMQALEAYVAQHPGMTPRGALRAMGTDVPPERTLQRWWSRWKSLPPQTTQTPQSLEPPSA